MKYFNYSSERSPDDYKKEYESLSDTAQNEAILNPGHVDESKWDKAKQISKKSYGFLKYPFIMWVYKHRLGGR